MVNPGFYALLRKVGFQLLCAADVSARQRQDTLPRQLESRDTAVHAGQAKRSAAIPHFITLRILCFGYNISGFDAKFCSRFPVLYSKCSARCIYNVLNVRFFVSERSRVREHPAETPPTHQKCSRPRETARLSRIWLPFRVVAGRETRIVSRPAPTSRWRGVFLRALCGIYRARDQCRGHLYLRFGGTSSTRLAFAGCMLCVWRALPSRLLVSRAPLSAFWLYICGVYLPAAT